ncbi:MAG: rhodanese-like domain-containing protein [Candidatus Nitricoxidivorans perseverans]|uniref:Rhodanese-like domain-containing protein n=1 Tax=Candidatus Nitricoxidivorans perseverans TaxID=2975601 RepID=A0AA49IZ26_9PROT|nr:MAG: rhodanese-like domain-containing protein [Candidatus Nitricoxidivorans perseverans]
MAVTPHELVVEAKSQIREVPTAEAQILLGKRVIIDVREYDEFAAGHLPGAINIPRGVLEFKIGMVPECANKDGAFLLYCRTSGRAALSAVQLQRIGYGDVISMAGGFEVWNNENRPTEKPEPINFE